MHTHVVSIVLGILTSTIAGVLSAGALAGTCVDVVDGDTIVVQVEGTLRTVSLAAVDAPELGQPFGDEARDLTAELVLDREVAVEPAPGGSADVVVGRVVIGDTDLAVTLLEAGLAWHDAIHDSQEQLVIQHIMARSAKRGLWSEANPVAPWQWRANQAPTPVPRKKMNLADVASQLELEKDADGKVVITQPTPSARAGGGGDSSGPTVTNMFGEEMCCCEVKKVTGDRDSENSDVQYIYQWQEKVACEQHAMQIIEATDSMHFFERCVGRSNCPSR